MAVVEVACGAGEFDALAFKGAAFAADGVGEVAGGDDSEAGCAGDGTAVG